MLRFLSKRKRSGKALLVVFVAVLALGLIGVFTPGWSSGLSGSSGDDTAIAKVVDHEVTLGELRTAVAAYNRQLAAGRGSLAMDDPSMVYSLYGKQIVDNLVRQKLILYEAEKRNMVATDQEVQERLRLMFNPWPGPEQYRRQLQQVGVTPVKFEDDLRAMIAEEKLRSYITAAVQVSPQEVEEEYRRTNTNYTVRWVEVTPDKFRDKVQVTDAELRAFFEQNKGDFRITTEQRRARYIFVDQSKAGESIQISDEELKKDFVPENGVQQVRVSQIVLNIPKPGNTTAAPGEKATSPEDEVTKKAEDIVRRAQGAEGTPKEDFATLARQYSDDARSKASGGDIGLVNKSDKRDTDDPLNRVFAMQKDEVSQPIRRGNSFYILKVTDRKLPTFEESREQLLKEARTRKGYTRAVEIATEAEQKFRESKNAEAVAAEINGKYGTQVATIKETPLFAEGDSLPDVGAASELESAVFELENINDITERLNVNNGFAIAQYIEKRDPHDPSFEEVRAKVEDRYRSEKAKSLAAERARQLGQSASPDALKAAADAAGLRTDERAGIPAGDSIGPLISESDRAAVYRLKPGQVAGEPIKVQDTDTYVVASLIARKDADMGETFEKERKGIEERLLQTKRDGLFSTFVASAQKRMKDEGEIKIYQEVIDEAMASGGGAGSVPGQGGPGFPQTRTRPRRTPPVVPPAGQ